MEHRDGAEAQTGSMEPWVLEGTGESAGLREAGTSAATDEIVALRRA
jgi:hypothetical protein